jgi:Fe2+ transport system protein FeoA
VTLADAKEGQWLIVAGTEAGEVTMQALRFGIEEGARIRVRKKIPGGPVIVARNQLEIAVGRQIAEAIRVVPGGEGECHGR